MRNIQIITVLLVSIILVYLAVFGRALQQDENHLSILIHVPKAFFSSSAVKIDDEKYLAKNTSSFIKTIEQEGFVYLEQMGSGHFLENENGKYLSSSTKYSSHFMLFTSPSLIDENTVQPPSESNFDIVEVLSDSCEVDSDCQTPHEYLIRSSCPYTSKCIDNSCTVICQNSFINPEWVKITQAITDCEVVSVMQSHSREVSAVLKDGRELHTVEPELDDVIDLVTQSQEKCGQVSIATE